MPILDVQAVPALPPGAARLIADAAARVLETAPRRTWVRIQPLLDYAENGGRDQAQRPVFVRVLMRRLPDDPARTVRALTDAIAEATGRPAENVHVLCEPPGAGRAAFGGELFDP